jgi:hypothetical protein
LELIRNFDRREEVIEEEEEGEDVVVVGPEIASAFFILEFV